MREIIETIDDYQVLVCVDEYPTEPYDDGGSPILRYDGGGYGYDSYKAEQVTDITSHVVDDDIVRALTRWGDDSFTRGQAPLFERYLKMFHGARSVKWHDDYRGGWKYVTFDTAEWREEVGLTDHNLALMAREGVDTAELANMDEYVAYLNGEAYGWIVQKRERWIKLDADGETTDELRLEWETVESCWGYYDREYVEQEAVAALRAEAV